jgi:FAD/FMN-containing dehydrogenase
MTARSSVSSSIRDNLRNVLSADSVLPDVPRRYLVDETETRDEVGRADAVVLPDSADDVAAVVRFAYDACVPVIPRGGGTGYAGGAVPDGGIVLALERLRTFRSFDPFHWRMEVEAGVTTAEVRGRARANGLYFPPDPGAGEQSQIGGNIATNAGGPHAFKYGTTGAWVTGLEVVVPPGDVIHIGGPIRKDVAGYDLKHLLIGSEGTLGIITAAWLRLIPAPEASRALVAFFPDAVAGCAGMDELLGCGVDVAALEFVDEEALSATPATFAPGVTRAFAILVEAEGAVAVVDETLAAACEALGGADFIYSPETSAEQAAVWRWREGMTAGVTAQLGGKVSEDVVVPVDRLAEAIIGTREIGARHGLRACSWGHAGDGNLHSTFMVRRGSPSDLAAADFAALELFDLAVALGGSVSGEHGIGTQKLGQLQRYWQPRAYELHTRLKDVFDPLGLLNPGKKR